MATTWQTLKVGAGGFVTGGDIASDGTNICRTDVGGGYWWNGSVWAPLGTGLTAGTAQAIGIAVMQNGNIIVGGDFTAAGGVAASFIAMWNGSIWVALGSGCNNKVYRVAVDADGRVHAGGIFTSAGGLTLADRYAIWNGTSWVQPDLDLPGSPQINALLLNGNDIYLGYDTAGTATASKLNTLTNSGSRTTYPKIVIKRSGGTSATVEWLKNETTGATLWLNYALLDGETLTIDCKAKTITSDFFGNVIGLALLSGSEFGSFDLIPGANSISVYVLAVGSPTLTAYATWPLTHWALDTVA